MGIPLLSSRVIEEIEKVSRFRLISDKDMTTLRIMEYFLSRVREKQRILLLIRIERNSAELDFYIFRIRFYFIQKSNFLIVGRCVNVMQSLCGLCITQKESSIHDGIRLNLIFR